MYRQWLKIETKKPYDFIDITEKVQQLVEASGIKNGMVFLNSMHNTAALLLQENDRTIFEDMKEALERILPLKAKYHHDYEGNLNATAHIKTNLIGSSLTLPLEDGRLLLGTWQRIFFVEWFEARERKVLITVIGD